MSSIFLTENLIFLNIVNAEHQQAGKFDLSKEDIKLIQYYFFKVGYKINFETLPESTGRYKVDSFFKILKNNEHQNWIPAYLLLLEIVPELFVDDIGC